MEIVRPNIPIVRDLTAEDLRALRIEAGMTIPDAAERVGVARSTWWRWEEKNQRIPPEHRTRICAAFGIDHLHQGRGGTDAAGKAHIPLYSMADGVPGIADAIPDAKDLCHEFLTLDAAHIKSYFRAKPESCFALSVEGDAMAPTIRSGEIAMVSRANPAHAVSDGIALILSNGALLLRRVTTSPSGELHVSADGGDAYSTFSIKLPPKAGQSFEIIGRVVGLLMRRL